MYYRETTEEQFEAYLMQSLKDPNYFFEHPEEAPLEFQGYINIINKHTEDLTNKTLEYCRAFGVI